ncbi:MAG: hypothetical protein M3162_09505, partial [Thermoproteota archaeon]|nr:hypothetical protein [Thermoproteota archaeon]
MPLLSKIVHLKDLINHPGSFCPGEDNKPCEQFIHKFPSAATKIRSFEDSNEACMDKNLDLATEFSNSVECDAAFNSESNGCHTKTSNSNTNFHCKINHE